MFQIGPREIGADLAFGVDLALFILQCGNRDIATGDMATGQYPTDSPWMYGRFDYTSVCCENTPVF